LPIRGIAAKFLLEGLTQAVIIVYIFVQTRTNPDPPLSVRIWEQHKKEVSAPMTTIRKSDVSASVAAKLGGSKSQGEAALKAVLDSIKDSLSAGDRVVLTGFGSFEVRQVKARRVRPIRGGQAGTLVTVPAHKRVGFTAGAELTKAARG
jgi:DNA-binding protein HU-beta